MSKQLAMSLSLDLDNKWSYMKTHGNPEWEQYPSYFDVAIPRILEFLDKHDVKITFFIVGQDAALEKNHTTLKMIAAAGHEIANHSFRHEPWLHLYSREELEAELEKAEQAIEQTTGVRVKGFRGPGFSLSKTTLEVLRSRGYDYDASSLPNALNPLARAYFFKHSNLSDEEKEQRKALFGTFSDALRPVKPYQWNLEAGKLLELPVTTMPMFKVPIHFSYLIYLATYSPWLARQYLRFTMLMCRMTATEPSLLLHPLDYLGAEDAPELAFFPGMKMGTEEKLEHMADYFVMLKKHFRPLTMGEHVAEIAGQGTLKEFEPRFAHENA